MHVFFSHILYISLHWIFLIYIQICSHFTHIKKKKKTTLWIPKSPPGILLSLAPFFFYVFLVQCQIWLKSWSTLAHILSSHLFLSSVCCYHPAKCSFIKITREISMVNLTGNIQYSQLPFSVWNAILHFCDTILCFCFLFLSFFLVVTQTANCSQEFYLHFWVGTCLPHFSASFGVKVWTRDRSLENGI